MDKHQFYYLELLTFQDLNASFDDAETADHNLVNDAGTYGVRYAGVVAEHSPNNLTVTVSGPSKLLLSAMSDVSVLFSRAK